MSVKKIVVIGPESTGKSTLSRALAKSLQTVWVPEYARAYLEGLGRSYVENDLLQIAKGQIELEEKSLNTAHHFLIADTDLNVIKVWSEHKYGRCHRWILENIAERAYDLYLLTDIDMPWSFDPLREHEAPQMRTYFLRQYQDIVMNSGVEWRFISGDETKRLETALQYISQYWFLLTIGA